MQQSPTTRERIVEFFESESSCAVYTPTDVARAVERSLDSVRTEMRGLCNAGVIHRKRLKGNVSVYWHGEEPLQLAPPRKMLALEAIDVRSSVVAA